ncbi:MAG TPA: ACT domain-containing protein, partial [Pirellulales bacterium]
ASVQRRAALSFTVPQASLTKTQEIAAKLSTDMGLPTAATTPAIAKLSVSGVGLRSNTQVAIRMFRALSEAGINVRLVSTSEVRVNVIVNGDRGQEALQVLQREFADALK